jgi:hypothetical protein
MAIQSSTQSSSGIFKAIQGALDVFSGINKARGVSENLNPTPELDPSFSMSDKEFIEWKKQKQGDYNKYYGEIEPSQTLAFEYWIGKQKADDEQITGQALTINKIFKAIETFIPIATRANPDPLVKCDETEIGDKLGHALKSALVKLADTMKLRKILKRVIRHWIIYRIGILKVGYDPILEKITTEAINPKRWMGDIDGHWDEEGFFTGEWQAEKKKSTADKMLKMFGKNDKDGLLKAAIDKASKGKKGTKLEYIEWWIKNREIFYTMEDIVLGKYKNPHWNWDVEGKDPVNDPETGAEVLPGQEAQPGTNHFDEPKAPYIGLSIFSTGLQPHDETGLVLQNIPLQDEVNERARQISRNVKGMNGGVVVSSDFTESQAAGAAAHLRKGGAIRSTGKDVRAAIVRLENPAMPSQVFEQQVKSEQELEDIFGISGSSPNGIDNEDTVRGKIMSNQMDSSRIGGGVTEYLEQVADAWYNYLVQLMFVHYTDPHYFITAGTNDGQTLVAIKNTDFLLVDQIDITVKEGSLIPKDPLTQRNEAIDLWSANAIDPRNFYKRLDFADPDGMTQSLILWQMLQKGQIQPQMYLPTFQVAAPMQPAPGALPTEQPGTGGPAVSPPPNTPQPGAEAPMPQSAPAVQAQSSALLKSVPA